MFEYSLHVCLSCHMNISYVCIMAIHNHLQDIRKDYILLQLNENDIDPDPFVQFGAWIDEAVSQQVEEPTAMTLATVSPDGRPSVRIVLLKQADENGLCFFTNYASRKGKELGGNSAAALLFFWPQLQRQIRVEGYVEKMSDAESDQYFQSRPRDSQLGAVASPQSTPIRDRKVLEDKLTELEARYAGKAIDKPAHWGGYRLKPDYFEFWQGRGSRLHDRLVYEWQDDKWLISRLAP